MIRQTLIAAALAAAGFAHAGDLKLSVYNADGNSFNVSSVLVTGDKDAVLIDTGFTRADAYRIAAKVLDSGKNLKTIYVSQADPDYYFGASVLKQIFPKAELVAAPEVLAHIKGNVKGKVAFWGPKMGANAPQAKPLLPTALKTDKIMLEGKALELRDTKGVMAHRGYMWIPSIRAIVGNVGIYSGMHVWTADTQNDAERKGWYKQLDDMEALKPEVVVPGHMIAGDKMDVSAIRYTRDYLKTFEAKNAETRNSGELIEAMKQAYPNAAEVSTLELGAKVRKGEMKW
ncbi:MBL fold metallo-hydrolase [Chromobacterium phragmitis]|uniref:MBL fold metallo-hydrolase n=1 Tax=Chromobacterium phragmitis TaxID=2202141 RepID=A0A344UEE1_9NEIS|nr:MBL fold metallo-hydrolase [Chromobacterium phragmitis]AXE32299.1 MBL fold metallo-hydrolase [Chromobacterium phragmitis]AXE33639.1 MBL fold metallo-hydrolase [Chromobacterium phragmitis]